MGNLTLLDLLGSYSKITLTRESLKRRMSIKIEALNGKLVFDKIIVQGNATICCYLN